MSKPVVLAHLYPREMNIYGDWGNIIALRKRLEWRGYSVDYLPVNIGDDFDFTGADIVFGGGGQDKGQIEVADELQRHRQSIHDAVRTGVVFLLVCGSYQLFGENFTTSTESQLPGIGVFDAETVGSEKRLIGNVVIRTEWGELVGFENHSGRTNLNANQAALGRVIQGHGNNGQDGFEGAIKDNVFGTYLHGSLLPKNPRFCDELLLRALKRQDKTIKLESLDDELAYRAVEAAKSRPR